MASALTLTAGLALPSGIALAQEAMPAAETPLPTLTLPDALARAARADPAIAGSDARARAAEAGVRQADVRTNPRLGVAVENLPTIGGGGLIDRTEVRVTYSQELERGGDRVARTGRARSEADLVAAEARVKRLDRLEQAQIAYVDVLVAEAEFDVARQRLALAERVQAETERRVAAARDPLFAGSRAEAELVQAQIDLDQAETRLRVARIALAKFWDGTVDFFIPADLFYDTSASRAAVGEIAQADLQVFDARRDVAAADAAVERAAAVPNATVDVGLRHDWDTGGVGLVVGGSIPLQRYDSNQGAIDRAEALATAATADRNAFRLEKDREVARLQVEISSGASEARRLQEDALPLAERAVQEVEAGFARGGFSYGDVVAAHRALIDLRLRLVQVLSKLHRDVARRDRLTGAHDPFILQSEAR
ncbi:MAG: TolC family protein [Brevundimonas sp.]|uniref:TolC family protein n=1 Tax=Brevundimonas sp. TaxID=1871086 RepID=UPI002ABC563D|nr:TolC family protein [Brevundimonas sp.]MDZ4108119.1 TolC family protein [Brevundimonas sp.]